MTTKTLSQRQRFLLEQAWNGNVYAGDIGRYYLRTTPVTNEFRALVARGYAQPPSGRRPGETARVVWFSDEVQSAMSASVVSR